MDQAYIVALKVNAKLQSQLNALRARYFPPGRNVLEAHITMFHALPGAERHVWEPDLAAGSAACAPFTVRVVEPYSLGRGVALRVEAGEIGRLHASWQESWRAFLTPQDSQKRRAHCTIQNKVDPVVARETLAAVRAAWFPLEGEALGVTLFEYVGGPWRLVREFGFSGG